MSVTLKQFVEQVLLDITRAVDKAKEDSPIPIAPGYVEGRAQIEPQLIEFSIQVAVTEEESGKGKGEVSVPIISVVKANAGGEIGKRNERITTQSLKFSVPVYFQSKKQTGDDRQKIKDY